MISNNVSKWKRICSLFCFVKKWDSWFYLIFSTQNGDRQPSWFWTQNFSLIAEMDARGLNHSENICCFCSNAQSQLVLAKGYFFKMAADGHLEYFKFTFFIWEPLFIAWQHFELSKDTTDASFFMKKYQILDFFRFFGNQIWPTAAILKNVFSSGSLHISFCFVQKSICAKGNIKMCYFSVKKPIIFKLLIYIFDLAARGLM